MSELKAEDRARLERARLAGLFAWLDDPRIEALYEAEEFSMVADDVVAELVESYLSHEPRELCLHAPQSALHLIELLPALAAVVRDDPDGRYIHLLHDDDPEDEDERLGTLFAPETHHAWVGVFNTALKIAGDERSFVALPVRDHEEPLYLLVTPAQYDALAAIALLAWDNGEIELPNAVWANERAQKLAKVLVEKGVPARGAGDRVELTLDLAGATALLERLRADHALGERRREYVTRALKSVP